MKADDHNGADMCYSCHMAFDTYWPYPSIDKQDAFTVARIETIRNRIRRGKIKKEDTGLIEKVLIGLINQ